MAVTGKCKWACFINQPDEPTKYVDLILTTASTSGLEFLYCGLCVGIARAIDNQVEYYKTLGGLGVAAQFGYRGLGNHWELDEKQMPLLVKSHDFRSN